MNQGHANISITLFIYAHMFPYSQEKAVQTIDEALRAIHVPRSE